MSQEHSPGGNSHDKSDQQPAKSLRERMSQRQHSRICRARRRMAASQRTHASGNSNAYQSWPV